jgi:hypothetical protein
MPEQNTPQEAHSSTSEFSQWARKEALKIVGDSRYDTSTRSVLHRAVQENRPDLAEIVRRIKFDHLIIELVRTALGSPLHPHDPEVSRLVFELIRVAVGAEILTRADGPAQLATAASAGNS